LAKLGRRNDAVRLAWSDFQRAPSQYAYRDLLKLVPAAERRLPVLSKGGTLKYEGSALPSLNWLAHTASGFSSREVRADCGSCSQMSVSYFFISLFYTIS
jgi:hypothetical protein